MKPNFKAISDILAHTNQVKLVAATKYVDANELDALRQTGITIFGENRVQDFLKKYPASPAATHWHFIGTLQTNKVKDIIDKVELIHSVDSIRLIDEIQKQAQKKKIQAHILLQVNIAKEESKHGWMEEDISEAFDHLQRCPNITVHGLMMMAPHISAEKTRIYFQKTRALLERLQKQYPEFPLSELSMGMSNDYPIAIEEGATIIRIGRALFQD